MEFEMSPADRGLYPQHAAESAARMTREIKQRLEEEFTDHLKITVHPGDDQHPSSLTTSHEDVGEQVTFTPELSPSGEVQGYHIGIYASNGALQCSADSFPNDGNHARRMASAVQFTYGDLITRPRRWDGGRS
jgi:hypothetical protein